MRWLSAAALALLLAGAQGAPAVAEDDPLQPIHQLLDGYNAGDWAAANAAYAAGDITIIDEVLPHLWRGADAPQAWAADYARQAARLGIKGGQVGYGAPLRSDIDGDRAYVVLPVVSRYRRQDQPIAEEAQLAFVLEHGPAGWKIRAWSWSGVTPHPQP